MKLTDRRICDFIDYKNIAERISRNKKYIIENNGIKYCVYYKQMTPLQYIQKCAKIFDMSVNRLIESRNDDSLRNLKSSINSNNYGIIYIDKYNKVQDGLHRAIILMMKKIPKIDVLVIENTNEENNMIKTNDMALSRTDAMDRCISLGKKFIQHFDKIYRNPKSSAKDHWISEMNSWYKSVKEIKLKQSNDYILSGELRDWFFTAGANPQDFMINPTNEEIKLYDEFTNKILNGNNINNILKGALIMNNKDSVVSKIVDLGKYYKYDTIIMKKANDYSLKLDELNGENYKIKVTGEPEMINNFVNYINEYHNAGAKIIDSKSIMNKDSIIPNSAKTLEITFKINTSNEKVGEKKILKRNERGEWSDGKYWYPVSMLRNTDVVEVKILDKKSFKVSYRDRAFKVKANDHEEAARKIIDKFNNVSMKDSSKLYDLAYKLGQLANYFDRANSINSRNILGKEDEAKKAEFYNLGLQTYNQLKFEVEQMRKAGNTDNGKYSVNNNIVDLLDDASNEMFHLRDPKLRLLHEKLEPLIRDYERLVK